MFRSRELSVAMLLSSGGSRQSPQPGPVDTANQVAVSAHRGETLALSGNLGSSPVVPSVQHTPHSPSEYPTGGLTTPSRSANTTSDPLVSLGPCGLHHHPGRQKPPNHPLVGAAPPLQVYCRGMSGIACEARSLNDFDEVTCVRSTGTKLLLCLCALQELCVSVSWHSHHR